MLQTNSLDERYLARVMLANLPPVPERGSVPRPIPRTGSGGALRASSNAAVSTWTAVRGASRLPGAFDWSLHAQHWDL